MTRFAIRSGSTFNSRKLTGMAHHFSGTDSPLALQSRRRCHAPFRGHPPFGAAGPAQDLAEPSVAAAKTTSCCSRKMDAAESNSVGSQEKWRREGGKEGAKYHVRSVPMQPVGDLVPLLPTRLPEVSERGGKRKILFRKGEREREREREEGEREERGRDRATAIGDGGRRSRSVDGGGGGEATLPHGVFELGEGALCSQARTPFYLDQMAAENVSSLP